MAASLVQSMEISTEEYDNIFGSSDEEMSNEDSDIDHVSELEDESDENDESGSESACGSESESDEAVDWTDRLQNIHLKDFTSPVGITFEIGNEARELDVFKKLFNDEILNVIARETNRYARQKL